jgi:putative phosphoesterase
MRIAIVADVHGNRTALEAVIADVSTTSPDLVLHGGDLAGNGSDPPGVVDRIRDLGWPGVYGNVDEILWAPERVPAPTLENLTKYGLRKIILDELTPFTREQLGDARIAWLKNLPMIEKRDRVAVVHASPESVWNSPAATAPDDELTAAYAKLNQPVAVFGHIHHPFVRTIGGLTVANTGSVSLSYDGDPRASYLLIDNGTASTRRVEYDIDRECKAVAASGCPRSDWICAILRAGRYLPPD